MVQVYLIVLWGLLIFPWKRLSVWCHLGLRTIITWKELWKDHERPTGQYQVLAGGVKLYVYFHPYLGKWSNLTNIFQTGWIYYSLRIQVCPKKGIGLPTFLFFSDGIGTPKILFDRKGFGVVYGTQLCSLTRWVGGSHLSYEKKTWLLRVYRGWNPTQLYRDYFLSHYKDPY